MLDLSHIPNSQQDIKIFYANSGGFGYQTWQKPRKCNFVYIISIDGGGGGSSGRVATDANATSGLAGGGSGAVTRALIDSKFVPDTLYIKVGKGGKGGAAATVNFNTGGSAEASGVFASSRLSSQGLANPFFSFLGGYTPSSGGGLTVGTGASATTTSTSYQVTLTTFTSTAGISSAATASSTTPTEIQPLASQIVTAGCTGAPITSGSAFNGGSINSSSFSLRIAGGIGDAALGTDGSNGFTSWNPFFSTGGAGGGNAHTSGGVAGKGGNGGIGSGGGAGGSAASGSTSGAGGDGGDGVVIIISF